MTILRFLTYGVGDDEEKYWTQVLAVVIGSLSAVNSGIMLSWSSPFLSKLVEDKENYDISEEEASYFSVIQPIAMMVSCILFSSLSDIIGRKTTLLLTAIPQLFSWIITATARSVYLFYIARILAGISDGIMFTTLPAYIGEVSNPEVRGTWGNYLNIAETSSICIFLVVTFFITFLCMPESPYYYIMRGKDDDARKTLIFLKWKRDIEQDFLSLKADILRQMSEKGTWKDLFMELGNRRALVVGLFVRTSQQFGGAVVFFMNIQFVFEKSGVNWSASSASIIYLALALFLNLLMVTFLIDRIKRKTSFAISSLLSGIVLIMLSIYYYLKQYLPDMVTVTTWVPIGGMALYQIFSSMGLGVIPILLLGELFSTSIRSKAMTVVMISFGLSLFISNYILFSITRLVGLSGPFLFYGICSVSAAALSIFLIPETKGKTLEEIQQILKGMDST
ncbi:hypothetical protein JTB14_009422 [Gonioctena quinquepunctata]|nr:hypothetical protein JTB14_009422 [Gonioctena quinquepunctata]